ncbi:hypothetical protein [Streptomyces sp. NPDC059894]|uniref:hypothetical protein n=1 Tax=unclassified Streptomyces TaxID=2593676 RepID=UPI003661D30A
MLDEIDAAVQYYGTFLELLRRAPTAGANSTVAIARAIAQFEAGGTATRTLATR